MRSKYPAAVIVASLAAALASCADPTAPFDVVTSVAEDRSMGRVANDAGIKLDFNRRLATGADRDLFFDVNSDVYEGRMMLTGAVRTAHDRARAVQVARGTPGVRVVYDDIQVTDEGGIGRTARDALIEGRLKTRLVGARGIRSINYRWQSINGTVYLIGRARSARELDALLAVVKDTADVRRVVHHIEIVPGSA